MKRVSIYAMAILLVPWSSCQEDNSLKTAEVPSVTANSNAEMILPNAKDTLLPSGRRNVYLVGSRNSHGFFIERSVFPAGYKGMPHIHNSDLYITVIMGTAHLGMGNRFDTTDVKPYGPGSFMFIPKDQPHYEWFNEECHLQIEGVGPQETFYVMDSTKNK